LGSVSELFPVRKQKEGREGGREHGIVYFFSRKIGKQCG
jgi:hypothetical protein